MKLLALIAVLAGCGASSNGVCKKACTKTVSCSGGTTQQISDCQMQCDSTPIDLSSCTNSGDILSCADDCLNQNCNDYGKCVGGCPKCVTNGQDLSMSSNNGDMQLSAADMSLGWCGAFCTKAATCRLFGVTSASSCESGNTCNALGSPNACQQTCIETTCATAACNDYLTCIQTCSQSCP